MKLYEISISRGEHLLKFIEYLDRGIIAKKHRVAFEQLGNALLKQGFEFNYVGYLFVKMDKPQGHWIVVLPTGKTTSAHVELTYTGRYYDEQGSRVRPAGELAAELDELLSTTKKEALTRLT